ncbi:MAG: amidohydrolase family protein [Spirochaetales bacterium]|nr:amidohydrolase family protein [Spirochaetales bacterium]
MRGFLVKGGTVFTADGFSKTDVLVSGQKIAAVGDCPDYQGPVIDAGGLYVLPGIIDAHTHYHLVSRGTVTADSFPQGSRCAAFGGVTTVVDFADHDKSTTLLGSAESRIGQMRQGMAVDFALHQGVYGMKPDIGSQLESLKAAGINAIKLFTTYRNVGYMIDDPRQLEILLRECRRCALLVTVHCEDDNLIQSINDSWKGQYRPIDHAALRPPRAEALAIAGLGELALKNDVPLYIVHLSSAEGLEAVRSLRRRGAQIIVETTPHYLFLDKSALDDPVRGPLYLMTPPLRSREDNLALQRALSDGEIQVVATDHCSFTYEQKLESRDCRTIYPGTPGSEELLVLLHTFSVNSGVPFSKILPLVTSNPASLFGLFPKKGLIAPGADADLVLFDPEKKRTITDKTAHSAAGYSIYDGFEVCGQVRMTFRRGEKLVDGNDYFGVPGSGKLLFQDTASVYGKN